MSLRKGKVEEMQGKHVFLLAGFRFGSGFGIRGLRLVISGLRLVPGPGFRVCGRSSWVQIRDIRVVGVAVVVVAVAEGTAVRYDLETILGFNVFSRPRVDLPTNLSRVLDATHTLVGTLKWRAEFGNQITLRVPVIIPSATPLRDRTIEPDHRG